MAYIPKEKVLQAILTLNQVIDSPGVDHRLKEQGVDAFVLLREAVLNPALVESAQTVGTLQEAINKRAADRLDADLKAVATFMRENRIMSVTNSGFPNLTFDMIKAEDQEKPNRDTKPPYWAFQYERSQSGFIKSSTFMDNVRAYWLPIYIQEETEGFMEKAAQLNQPETED
jgi:hypothetical protein